MLKSGFLIVKTFELLYIQFPKPWDGPGEFYGIPKKGYPPSHCKKRYRGIDRDPLEAFSDQDESLLGDLVVPRIDPPAQRLMAELEGREMVEDDFILALEDALSVYSMLEHPNDFELIWTRDSSHTGDPPPSSTLLGFEPTWFTGDHFSAISDCLFFPRWHGPDEKGTVFISYYSSLNENGLFNTPAEARDFLAFYHSFDWSEKGNYVIAEIREQKLNQKE